MTAPDPRSGTTSSGPGMRVALLTTILSPYRLPVFRDLAATPGWRLRVFVGAKNDPSWDRAFAGAHERGCNELDVEIVRNWSFRRRVRTHAGTEATQSVETHIPIGTFASLRDFRPDVILSVELGARTSFAALYARIHHIPLVIWSYQSRSWAATAGPALRMWRRALLSRADAVVGMGTQAREVLSSLGVPAARVFDAPNAHDQARLTAGLTNTDAASSRSALRTKFSCRERVALVAGRLVAAKGILPLLAAWRRLDKALRSDWTLLFVGDGPLRREILRAASAGEPGEIVCGGAVTADAMAGFYAGVDLLVFPSLGDPWGLVVNEALASGVPVLCSKLAGCADDLIVPDENGWTFDPTDANELHRALSIALSNSDLAQLGVRGRQTVAPFTPESMARGLRSAVTSATKLPT